jgi:enamine deaminase RidA (YjgF/YER057c/UK114 family)
MTPNHDSAGMSVEKRVLPTMQVITLARHSHRELFITTVADDERSTEEVLPDIARMLRDDRAHIVSQEVFAISNPDHQHMQALSRTLGSISWPVTWVGPAGASTHGVGGTQIWAVSGVPVEPLKLNGRLLGSVFEDDYARYCRLGDLLPTDLSRSRDEQASEVLELMEAALRAADMEFNHVLRTWFYNDDILSWYREFNHVRNTFFTDKCVFDALLPASTAVGAPVAVGTGAALVSGLLAVKAKDETVRAIAVPSPLQCAAEEYGSSFSRAVELGMPDQRRLLVSGTASIGPEGNTAHIGNVDAQVGRTLDVVNAILESRGMGWADVMRGIAHFKRAEDASALRRCCDANQIGPLPVVLAQSEICRHDLLFELEVDAVTAGQQPPPRSAG